MITAFFFWLAYGTMALFLGPLRTWSAVLGLILWYQAATIHKDLLREAAQVWVPQPLAWEEEKNESQAHMSQSSL